MNHNLPPDAWRYYFIFSCILIKTPLTVIIYACLCVLKPKIKQKFCVEITIVHMKVIVIKIILLEK